MTKKRKNIILFLNAFWNNHQGLSGGDQIMVQTYQRLFDQFQQIYCYTSPDGQKIFPRNLKNINFILSIQAWDKLNIMLNYILRTIKALSCLKLKNIQVLHSSSDFFPDVIPAYVYKLFYPSTKWVVNVMHIYPNWIQRPGNKLNNLIAALTQRISFGFIKKADVIITLNQQVKSELIKQGQLSVKIKIISAGIDSQLINHIKINPTRQRYDATFMARLKPSKGIYDLIKIWQKVMVSHPKLKLAIIGGGGDDATIKRLQTEVRVGGLSNNIFLLGFLKQTDSYAYIKASQVFILPSHEEGFGIVIAEALACGTPVLVWDLPIYHEIYNNHIIYIPEYNVTQFADQIIKVINNQKLHNRLSNQGVEYVKQFSWDKVATSYNNLLTRLVAK